MRISENLILSHGENITAKVKFCKYNEVTCKYDITFSGSNSHIYSYNCTSIEWIQNPKQVNPSLVQITHGGQPLFNIQEIRVFKATTGSYWYIRFSNGTENCYPLSELKITTSCLNESEAENCMRYLREIAAANELKGDDGQVLLQKQYEKLSFVDTATAMALFLNPKKYHPRKYSSRPLIFPFGGNASQFKAVEAALDNQLSVIQGPPGTGKTQTILNIVANLLVSGKTVQIVSNNNSATENVAEKLASPQYDLGFLVAPLGKAENKKMFLQAQTGRYPDLSSWQRSASIQAKLKESTQLLCVQLAESFAKQERLAKVRHELSELILESQYFEQYCQETDTVALDIKPKRSLKSGKLLGLWQDCNEFVEKECKIPFWFKFKSVFLRGIAHWKFYESELPIIITLLQSIFYATKKRELTDEISALEQFLAAHDVKEYMQILTQESLEYLCAVLFDRYGNATARKTFEESDLWKNAQEIICEYPVVLSTTFSSRSCLKDAVYDYIIMDEASQVDLATGALALAGAKNAVIVGDVKQLSNVVSKEMKKRCDAVFASYHLPEGYSFSQNSFLSSVCTLFPDIPQTLLREHYRCHPKIIDFCNQKFYNNELIIMTQDHSEADVLSVFRTVVGNHRRDRINQRQIDVMIQEAFPIFHLHAPEEIGVIAPYRDQVTEIRKQLPTSQIEVNTVHKFQGREKDVIVLTTVDDIVTDFSDKPDLLNVAVSRAKKKLCLIISGNEQPKDTNICELIDYIEYNNFKVYDSEIYSVFDLLYQQYTTARITFLKQHAHVSQYDSENLMHGAIVDLLREFPQLPLTVILHQPLKMLIRDPKYLDDEECRYVMHHATHLDFLVYNKISKKPIFAIEVDGFHNHKQGTPQYERDRKKDSILQRYGISFKRFPTNGSGEMEWLRERLSQLASPGDK